MEGGSRRQRWMNNNRRSQNRKPSHGSWQPKTVPLWEKDFCKAVGSLDWETFLQLKKCIQLYDNVINWNDSAGEEAFLNAKRRYYAEINGFSCDNNPLPDPNRYIQDIDWDSKFDDTSIDLESLPFSPEPGHEPVVIFGDSFIADQGFGTTGWGDAEEKFEVPDLNFSENYGGQWEGQNWDPSGWQVCNNDAWEFSDGNGGGYTSWGGGGGNNDGGWGYKYSNYNYVGPRVEDEPSGYNRYVPSYGTPRVHNKGRQRGSYRGKQDRRAGSREWNPINSCGPLGQRAGMRVGEVWNQ
ncbi:hypothetical protein CASFOL_031023 [Castilleja foliolosa]|uniref:Uncharacterized protein n=1 Tax=Castilleja foliolosa TaxID=1961234 RepID=A0ABD3C8D1_9LAMI